MNKIITSKAELLAAALRLIEEQGMQALSIRELAAAAGVSVGSVYNYFASKDELVLEVTEAFWRDAFHQDANCTTKEPQAFDCFFVEIYDRMSRALEKFRRVHLPLLGGLFGEHKQAAKLLEERYFSHMQAGMLRVLLADKNLSKQRFDDTVSPERLVEFLLHAMIAEIARGQEDPSFLLSLVRRLIY